MVDYEPWDFRFCPDCHGLLGGVEVDFRGIKKEPSSSDSDADLAVTGDVSESEEVTEPEFKAYENAELESLLALIGERLLPHASEE